MATEPSAAPLEVATLRGCEVSCFAALGPALLARAEAEPGSAPLLVIAELTGEALLLGQHQRLASCLDAECLRASGLPVFRRASGGRTLTAGAGAVGVLLALPTLDGLGAGPFTPDKLMNRTVRGLLAGLTRSGARANYFGRDFVSSSSQQLAAVGQDTLPRAGLFEAIIAVERSLALPDGLDGYPEHSDERAKGPPATTLAELRGSAPAFDELAAAIAAGYGDLSPVPSPKAEGTGERSLEDESGWTESGVADIPIGFVEALVRRRGDALTGVRLRGDFLAPTFALRELERSLVGAPLAFADLGARIDAAFHRPGAFIIGLRELRIFGDAILAAAADAPGTS